MQGLRNDPKMVDGTPYRGYSTLKQLKKRKQAQTRVTIKRIELDTPIKTLMLHRQKFTNTRVLYDNSTLEKG